MCAYRGFQQTSEERPTLLQLLQETDANRRMFIATAKQAMTINHDISTVATMAVSSHPSILLVHQLSAFQIGPRLNMA
jgi:hypothetical protein